MRLHIPRPIPDLRDGLLQLIRRHAVLLRPVAQFVVLVDVDALAILTAGLLLAVGHADLR
jgi:hypothetical protein